MSFVTSTKSPNLQQLLGKVFKIQGKDKASRPVLHIIAKFFDARIMTVDVVKKYLEEYIFPELEKRPFSVLYVHTDVEKCRNFPGISVLRAMHDAIPVHILQNLESVYFLHPGLQAKLFFATFGRFMFNSGLYGKLRYVSRIQYMWQYIVKNDVELEEFVYDHEKKLEYRPTVMDYGMEGDHHHLKLYDGPTVDYSPVVTYSTRCIS